MTTITRPRKRRPNFHELTVADVVALTDDAVAIEFEVPAHLRDAFAFRAGQHLTVRWGEARRSYSICSTPRELAEHGRLRIGVRQVPGGTFSTHARDLRKGSGVEVMAPLGGFTTEFDPGRTRHYGAIVAGSGITPVLSLVATALETEPASRFTVIYGNRYARSVMFAEELADLKDRHLQRLHVVHVLSREPQEAELLSGRLDADRLGRLFDTLVSPERVDEWFLCGPYGMVADAQAALAARGVPDDRVHTELFYLKDAPRAAEPTGGDAEVTIILDGRASTFAMGRHERVLDCALAARGELPYACKSGICATCRARIVDGEVRMASNHALDADQVAAGYVLTCQASPVTDRVVVDYDA